MKLSCKNICKLQEFFANLKCPHCFSAEVELCEDEKGENVECKTCGCHFESKPELLQQHGWE